MLPYWILYLLSAVPALQAQGGVRERNSRWGVAVLGLVIALLIGFRFRVGADWEAYTDMFELIRYLELGQALLVTDPAFAFLNWLVVQMGVDYWLVNVICGAIFAWGLMTFALRMPNPWLAIAVATPYLILVVAMGYSRQGVALGCVMMALVAAGRPAFLKFLFWTFVAVAFHKSAIAVLPIVALAYTRNRLVIVLVTLVSAVIGYFLFVASQVDVLLQTYVQTQYQSEGAGIRAAMNVVPAIIYLLQMKRFPISETERKIWRNFAVVGLSLVPVLLTVESTTLVDRLALYVFPLQLFVFAWIPTIFSKTHRSSGFLVVATLAYAAVVQFAWLTYSNHSRYWIPYRVYPMTSESV